MKKTYIETTIPGYLVSKPARDIIILCHQEITKEWWENYRQDYELYISPIVIEEINNGDPNYSKKRIDLIQEIPALDYDNQIENLAQHYMEYFNFNEKILRDVYHISYAVFYEMDFLLTWNCKHLANAHIRAQLSRINLKLGYNTPDICTPEELFQVNKE
jgi:hypothetical protein